MAEEASNETEEKRTFGDSQTCGKIASLSSITLEEGSKTSNIKKEKRTFAVSQTRETIAKVYHFLKKDAKDIIAIASDPTTTRTAMLLKLSDHVDKVRKRTAEAVGVSERSVTTILAEEKSGKSFKTPFKNRKKRRGMLEESNLNADIIHLTIQNYHTEHGELPSQLKLKRLLQENYNYTGSLTTLRRILLKFGFVWYHDKGQDRKIKIPWVTGEPEFNPLEPETEIKIKQEGVN